ncbi:lymphoid enhancer-binding factor 1 [Sarotherodon galilaeus]
MAAAGPEPAAGPSIDDKDIDLYSDLNQNDEDLDRIAEANELFDAVLTGSVNQDKNVATKSLRKETSAKEEDKSTGANTPKGPNYLRRLSVYVGHFPWWVTDKDLISMAKGLGVKNIADIKFAEDRSNGVSRGFAEVVITSDESLKLMLEKAPQCKINGERIDCRYATCQNLAFFEEAANKRVPLRANKETKESDSSDEILSVLLAQKTTPSAIPPLFPSHPLANSFPPLPGPSFGHPPPLFPHMPQTIAPLMAAPLFPPHPVPVPSHPSLGMHPTYFSPAPDGHSSKAYSQQKNTPKSSDRDLEELMNRNRTIASSAITKAVSGATAGDLQVAMETLLTAIAIIKQSRVYGDERCQTLVTSLKDCLVSIQGNYGYSEQSRSRERDRDRSRDRERERDRDREWSRDRDRERDLERSRERNRDRERSRGRERDRDWDRSRDRERDRDYSSVCEDAGMSRRHLEHSWSGEREKAYSRERERHRDHRDRLKSCD